MPKLVAASAPVIVGGAGRAPLSVRRHRDRSEGRAVPDQPRPARRSRDHRRWSLPHHIVFERCYLHGDQVKGSRRGIALNARDVGDRSTRTSRTSRRSARIPRRSPDGTGRGPSSSSTTTSRRRGRTCCSAAPTRPSRTSCRPTSRSAEPHRQAARVEGRRAGLRGQGVDGEEPARAQERAPGGHRGQSPRGQLAPGAERVRDSVHGAQPGRRARPGPSSRT